MNNNLLHDSQRINLLKFISDAIAKKDYEWAYQLYTIFYVLFPDYFHIAFLHIIKTMQRHDIKNEDIESKLINFTLNKLHLVQDPYKLISNVIFKLKQYNQIQSALSLHDGFHKSDYFRYYSETLYPNFITRHYENLAETFIKKYYPNENSIFDTALGILNENENSIYKFIINLPKSLHSFGYVDISELNTPIILIAFKKSYLEHRVSIELDSKIPFIESTLKLAKEYGASNELYGNLQHFLKNHFKIEIGTIYEEQKPSQLKIVYANAELFEYWLSINSIGIPHKITDRKIIKSEQTIKALAKSKKLNFDISKIDKETSSRLKEYYENVLSIVNSYIDPLDAYSKPAGYKETLIKYNYRKSEKYVFMKGQLGWLPTNRNGDDWLGDIIVEDTGYDNHNADQYKIRFNALKNVAPSPSGISHTLATVLTYWQDGFILSNKNRINECDAIIAWK